MHLIGKTLPVFPSVLEDKGRQTDDLESSNKYTI